MTTFLDSLNNTIKNAFCAYLDTFEGFQSWFFENDAIPTTPPTLVAARWANRALCNMEPPPFTGPPFQGGQCPVTYSITTEIYACVTAGCGTQGPYGLGNYLGPITGLRGGFQPGQGWGVFISHAGVESYFNLSSGGPTTYVSFDVQNPILTRLDGQPDNCGNPTPPIDPTPPPYPRIPRDVPYQDNDGNNFTIPIILVFAPVRVNIDGTLNVPFRIQLDPEFNVEFNGTLNINNGNINFNFGNPNIAPGPFPQPDDFDSPDNTPGYPPTVPNSISPISPTPAEPETKEVIRAVIVTVTANTSASTVIYQDNNPDIYAPDLGFINFAISVDNAVAWTSNIPVKNFRNFIQCDWEGGAIEVRGTPRPGVAWTITPIRAKIEKPIPFG